MNSPLKAHAIYQDVRSPIAAAAQPILGPGFPELPDPRAIPSAVSVTPDLAGQFNLREGCYEFEFRPGDIFHPEWPAGAGTIRLERIPPFQFIASGDFYRLDPTLLGLETALAGPQADRRELRSFRRRDYHAYLRVLDTSILPSAEGITGLEVRCLWHRSTSIEFNTWAPPEEMRLRLVPGAIAGRDLEGFFTQAVFELIEGSGQVVGTKTLQWVSDSFRDAVIEIDSEADLPPPLGDDQGATWESVFGQAGWRIRIETGKLQVPTPAIGGFTSAELHDALLRSRNANDLDLDWRYHISVVRHIVGENAPLGLAYDHDATDLNDVPREGVAVNAEAELPRNGLYGKYAGKLVRDFPELYFIIAAHEIGHAMGLNHNHVGSGIMETFDSLAENGPDRQLTRGKLLPEFDVSDLLRLRHLPDIYVRPGGTPWDLEGLVEDREEALSRGAGLFMPRPRSEGAGPFSLEVTPVAGVIPLGAPLRLNLSLYNNSTAPRRLPRRFGLGTRHLRGYVQDSSGAENEFRSVVRTIATEGSISSPPGKAVEDSLTLIRGNRGALFGKPGRYTVWMEVEWNTAEAVFRAHKKVIVNVSSAESLHHARAARELAQSPETLWYMVLGDNRTFQKAARIIDRALDVPELCHHYSYIKAKALAERTGSLPDSARAVRSLMAHPRSMENLNQREVAKAQRIIRASAAFERSR